MKSPIPAFYGDVPSLSLPVDWIMPVPVPNEDAALLTLGRVAPYFSVTVSIHYMQQFVIYP